MVAKRYSTACCSGSVSGNGETAMFFDRVFEQIGKFIGCFREKNSRCIAGLQITRILQKSLDGCRVMFINHFAAAFRYYSQGLHLRKALGY